MTLLAASVFRDYNIDNVPSSGANQVAKSDVRAWGTFLETLLSGSGAAVSYASVALLNANIAYPANTLALVYNDPAPANNGLYEKSGATGLGFWIRIGDLPNAIVRLTVTGGTGDAIIASAMENPTAPGSKLYLLTTTA